jgi:hypothetical protein
LSEIINNSAFRAVYVDVVVRKESASVPEVSMASCNVLGTVVALLSLPLGEAFTPQPLASCMFILLRKVTEGGVR